ncbi:hypothetical protein GLOTRDRAFT_80431 [Gloeophyllum trabeum ATCC 11539]|uniref:t-SNARE coiled-coil homology domain-containing protein n=1 Tax=Gloeophyllum trabeum (strain ATCC 11539 / FP-39264 / Madison 617) TaxID=670483 RepID=S7RHY7_GLOTA|nr:uncharacterized protein GLOTRDRAFT_80431 [Gloeophyllum trabeum ATCC 11539]EPQ52214.1 hypothetical protein GLOTRDRAFT_80431 [Gloeophyllum trabeum ATCC 11539]
MSTDPYHAVQQEVSASLSTAETLRASYQRIRSTASQGSEELEWARNELKATLAALEADLEDLEESVKIVERTGARMFGIEESELMERRQYVDRVRREIEGMRAELASSQPAAPPSYSSRTQTPKPANAPDESDPQASWAHQEQEMMLRQQDETLDVIGGTLNTLQRQAGLIGSEVAVHNEMLSDLETGVDRTESKLGDAMKRMRKFIRETEETKSGWCVVILTIVLLCLLLAVILV